MNAAGDVSAAVAISSSKGLQAYGETVLGSAMAVVRLVVWAEAFQRGGYVYHVDACGAAFGNYEAVLFPAREGAAAWLCWPESGGVYPRREHREVGHVGGAACGEWVALAFNRWRVRVLYARNAGKWSVHLGGLHDGGGVLDVEQAGTGCRFACGFGGGFGGVFHRSGGRCASRLGVFGAAGGVDADACEQVGGVDADEVGQLCEYLPLLAVFSYGYIHMRYVVLSAKWHMLQVQYSAMWHVLSIQNNATWHIFFYFGTF